LIPDYTPNDLCDELRPYIRVEEDSSWRLAPVDKLTQWHGPLRPQPPLKGYFFDREVELACVRHNEEWAHGKHPHPRFLFAYLTLSTGCELKCIGCFQGLDKNPVKVVPWQKSWLNDRLDEILDYLISRGGTSIAYAGLGELMTDPGAFDLIERVRERRLGFVMFTNGQVLADEDKVARLDELGVTVILSFRHTHETLHDHLVGKKGAFRRTVKTLSNCLQCGFRDENRFAMEMPITKMSSECAADMLRVTRELNVAPFLEIAVTFGCPENELTALSQEQTNLFLEQICLLDSEIGYASRTEWGQRVVGRPPCKRPWFTFTVETNKSIVSCPARPYQFGHIQLGSVTNVIESQSTMSYMKSPEICQCSSFFNNIYLEEQCQKKHQ